MDSHLQTQGPRFKVLTAGIISLILMLGVARFAYTPLLPQMQLQAGLGLAEGGWLSAINYLGYFSGALIAAAISDLQLKDRLYRWGLIAAVASTAMMAVTDSLWIWAASRFIAGLSSAAGLLIGSGLILNWLMRHNYRGELGIHFSGLGLGIALVSIFVLSMQSLLDWRELWLWLTAIGALLMIPAWRWLPRPPSKGQLGATKPLEDNPPSRAFLTLLMWSYFCAGIGYVVSATFIVAIVDQLPGLSGSGTWVFMIVGLSAAPACILWDLVARRIGYVHALLWAFALQAIGILLPVIEANLTLAVLGAILFGGTFIGIVSLVLTMAGHYYPSRPAKMMGKMTITFGIAQIIGPALTGYLATDSGNYNQGLYFASATMLLGFVLTWLLTKVTDSTSANQANNC